MNIFKKLFGKKQKDIISLITQDDKDVIMAKTNFEKAVAYCDLNTWKWPTWLPNEEPEFDSDGKRFHHTISRRTQLMAYLHSWIGEKYCSFIWNTQYKNTQHMTPEEFDKWWNEEFDKWWNKENQKL